MPYSELMLGPVHGMSTHAPISTAESFMAICVSISKRHTECDYRLHKGYCLEIELPCFLVKPNHSMSLVETEGS